MKEEEAPSGDDTSVLERKCLVEMGVFEWDA